MDNLRICLISPSRWRYTRRLAEELSNLGQTVLILVDKRDNSDIQNIRSPKCSVRETWKQNAALPWFVVRIPLEVIRAKPSVVHLEFEYLVFGNLFTSLFSPVMLLLLRLIGRLADFKTVMTMHSVVPLDKVDFVKRITLRPFTRIMTSLSDGVIVHTDLAKVTLLKTYNLNPRELTVIPHGIETKFPYIDDRKIISELKLSDKKVVFHFGIIRPGKGLTMLLKAFKRVAAVNENAVLVIAGWLHEYLTGQELRRAFSHQGISLPRDHVRLSIGFLPERRLYEILFASDVICLPYIENYVIGVSGAAADIVMSGKPIVVTNCLKFLEFRKFDNVVFIKEDEESLAETLQHLLKSKRRTVSFTDPGKYSWKMVGEKTLTYYRNLLLNED